MDNYLNDSRLEKIQIQKDSFEASITADVCLFGFINGTLKILFLKREVGSLKDYWLLPGGAMNGTETVEDCANKVLRYLIGVEDVHMTQLKVYSAVNRHPLKRVLTVSFYALIQPENHPMEQKQNVTEIKWFSLDKLPKKIGFDHLEIIKDAYSSLKLNLKNSLIFGELLPVKFTLLELQTLYESILEEKLDRRNFRKKILQMDILENTGIVKKGVKGGPFLFKRK